MRIKTFHSRAVRTRQERQLSQRDRSSAGYRDFTESAELNMTQLLDVNVNDWRLEVDYDQLAAVTRGGAQSRFRQLRSAEAINDFASYVIYRQQAVAWRDISAAFIRLSLRHNYSSKLSLLGAHNRVPSCHIDKAALE